METITVSKDKDGKLVSVDESCKIMGVVPVPDLNLGYVLTRITGAFSTLRYNVAKVVGEHIDGKNITYELEPLPIPVQQKIFEMYYTRT